MESQSSNSKPPTQWQRQESDTANPTNSDDDATHPPVDVSFPADYQLDGFDDELINHDGQAHAAAAALVDRLASIPIQDLKRRQSAIERTLFRLGVTFTVYSDDAGTEKIMPFDIIPRIIAAKEWEQIETGLKQRIAALNMFLTDVYGQQAIIEDGIVPRDVVESASGFLKECMGLRPFRDVWCHITGTDLVRGDGGKFFVLEDNLRCPSGASYVMQNRIVMKDNFPQVFHQSRVRPVNDYPARMYEMLLKTAPPHVDNPVVAVLTPGVFNSAYYEHSFFAQQMGVQLVEGRDLMVDKDDLLQMRTINGLTRVDVLYRRIDDTFVDPEIFNPESVLGVPGLMRAFRSGNLTLANAPGTGVADDKVVYAFVPQMIRYYLNQEPILPNVPTYLCHVEDDRKYVLEHMEELVVKAAAESGGYGLIVGPQSTLEQRQEFARRIQANPRGYIAQPTLSLSRVPTLVDDSIEGRHVDLRPYILCSGNDDIDVMPGGLTRVALRKGSLIVNSSQGGGSKDTWVIAADGPS
ncbi:MAG: circularly permuted type 2 ATP-grasp protein [Planctomycetota bacterium]